MNHTHPVRRLLVCVCVPTERDRDEETYDVDASVRGLDLKIIHVWHPDKAVIPEHTHPQRLLWDAFSVWSFLLHRTKLKKTPLCPLLVSLIYLLILCVFLITLYLFLISDCVWKFSIYWNFWMKSLFLLSLSLCLSFLVSLLTKKLKISKKREI